MRPFVLGIFRMWSRLTVRISAMVAAVTFGASLVTGVLALLLANGLTVMSLSLVLIAALGFAAIAAAAGYALTLRLSLPLLQLSEAAKRLATGDLTTAIPISGSEELISLGRSMDNARHELEGITRWLTHEKAWAEYLVDSISEGIVTLDAQNRVTFASKSAATLLGCKRSEALGKSLNDLLIPAEHDGHFTDMMPPEGSERTV